MRKTVTCELSCFHVQPAVESGIYAAQEWFAIATAHVYDPQPPTHAKIQMTPEAAVLSGVVMRTLEGRGSGTTELAAMCAALEVLTFQLDPFRRDGGESRDETVEG
jgi:hypothetical protein